MILPTIDNKSENIIDRGLSYSNKNRLRGEYTNEYFFLLATLSTQASELESRNFLDFFNFWDMEVGQIIDFIAIEELINFNYELKKPFEVKIIRDGSDVIGEISELDIYSFGKSDFEVLREINQDLTDLFDELTSLTNEQLGKKPKKWKNILSTHIKLTNGN